MNGGCHCGRVAIRLPRPPEFINVCNCSLCMKLGAAWGYFQRAEVAIEGETQGYRRKDVAEPALTAHFCDECGATVCWTEVGDRRGGRTAINMRLFEPADMAGLEVRYGDRRHDGEAEPRPYHRPPTTYDGQGAIP